MALVGEMQYLTIGGNTYSVSCNSQEVQGFQPGNSVYDDLDSLYDSVEELNNMIPANIVTGTGTTNKVPKFTATSVIGDGYGVTDNSSSTAVTSSDTNLITGRTLYYAGYTKNAGTVTSVQVQASGPITSSTSTAQSSTLNTTIGFSKPYVTEQNTGNGWTYRIWSNNTMEMWTTVTITAATNTSDAGGYKSASGAIPQNFPIAFAEIPVVQVTCDSNEVTGSVTSAARPTTTSAGEWRLYRHNSNTNTSPKNFMFYVIGTKAS